MLYGKQDASAGLLPGQQEIATSREISTCHQVAADLYTLFNIEMEQVRCCPLACCYWFDPGATQPKMATPLLSAGIEERYNSTSERVN